MWFVRSDREKQVEMAHHDRQSESRDKEAVEEIKSWVRELNHLCFSLHTSRGQQQEQTGLSWTTHLSSVTFTGGTRVQHKLWPKILGREDVTLQAATMVRNGFHFLSPQWAWPICSCPIITIFSLLNSCFYNLWTKRGAVRVFVTETEAASKFICCTNQFSSWLCVWWVQQVQGSFTLLKKLCLKLSSEWLT